MPPLVQALLIAATDPESGNGLSDSEIADELIVFLFAGHDTTATTLTYAMWATGSPSRDPGAGGRRGRRAARSELEPDDVAHLGYTVQVLREALRLCPPGPTGTRLATRDVEVGGYRVPAGTLLIFGRLTVQRDPTLWDDPLTFDPEAVQRGEHEEPRSLAVHPVRRRTARVHRRPLRDARGDARRWRRSSGELRYVHSTTNSRWPCRSRWWPTARFRPASGAENPSGRQRSGDTDVSIDHAGAHAAVLLDPRDPSDRAMLDELRADQRVAFLDEHEAQENALRRLRPEPDDAVLAEGIGGPTTRGGEPSSPCSGRGDSARCDSTATAT